METITQKHIKSKKRVGTLKDKAVSALETTGGLHMLVVNKSTGPEILAASPHPAVTRFIALKKEPELKMFELSKAEQPDIRAVESMAPKYEALTDYLNTLING